MNKIICTIHVLSEDIENGNLSDDCNPIALAISRALSVPICTMSIPLALGIFRQDNKQYGFCLGLLEWEPTKWLAEFFKHKTCNPFTFELQYHSPELALKNHEIKIY